MWHHPATPPSARELCPHRSQTAPSPAFKNALLNPFEELKSFQGISLHDDGGLVAQSRLTLCDPMDCSAPGFPVLHHLTELAQTHVSWVSDAIQPAHPLSEVGGHFLVQGIFLIQGSNPGLLPYRQSPTLQADSSGSVWLHCVLGAWTCINSYVSSYHASLQNIYIIVLR